MFFSKLIIVNLIRKMKYLKKLFKGYVDRIDGVSTETLSAEKKGNKSERREGNIKRADSISRASSIYFG